MHELKSALKNTYAEDELKEILKGVDTDKNGAINYTEFIAATLDKMLLRDKSKIEKAFKVLGMAFFTAWRDPGLAVEGDWRR